MKKLAILLMILILALAACGGDDSDSDADDNTDTEQTTSQTTEDTDATEEVEVVEDVTEEADVATEEATEEADVATEEATEEADDVATEEATEEADVATEEATEEADVATEEATEEAMEQSADDTDMTAEAEATEETDGEASEPVIISGWESLEEGCPTLFQFQYPPNWTITRSGGARVTFDIATDGGVSTGLIEYRGGIAPNQMETNYERFADIDTASVIYTMTFDGQEFPVYKDERCNNGPINYYYFFLPGRNLADNIRMTIQPDESGNFPPDEDMTQLFSTIVPNSCF